jgi:hypothetical protein
MVELERSLWAMYWHLLQRVHFACAEPSAFQRVRRIIPRNSSVSHLRCSYLCVVPDANGVPRVIMRHAVPNSPDRIKMIGAALKSCKFPVKRLRMLSLLTRHGFNEEETMFVEQQRYFESQCSLPILCGSIAIVVCSCLTFRRACQSS